jgi:cyclic pyranopterin phosphate synthase
VLNRPALPDRLGRPLRDLRISVTDRCNLRCRYCMPEFDGHSPYGGAPREELLTFEEITLVARAAVQLGVRKFRITGGEPLLRRDLPALVALLAAVPGVEDLALTTNGLLLPQFAQPLREAGLHRVTVSLDTLDNEQFQRITGRGHRVEDVLAGIDAAHAAGFSGIKVNTVLMRGLNEEAALPLVEHFRHTGAVLRFIEYMDVGNVNDWRREDVIPTAVVRQRIHARHPLEAEPPRHPGEVATRYRFADGGGELGFISSITAPFCGDCNRLRLSVTGELHTCLFSRQGHPLRDALRSGEDVEALAARMESLWSKRDDRYSEERFQPGDETGQSRPKVEMHHIGG